MTPPHWPTVNARAKARAKFDYPPELIAQAEQQEAKRAADDLAAKALCATCGKRRDHADHLYVASRNTVVCRFVEPSNFKQGNDS